MNETTAAWLPTEPLLNAESILAGYSAAALAWLHAEPQAPDMADLFDLDRTDFAVRTIHELLEHPTAAFDLTVQADYSGGGWMNHFYFESRNRERVFGTKNLYIGYPMVLCRVANREVAAPLFLWQTHVEPHQQNVDHWQVTRASNHPTIPNLPLFHWLDKQYDADFMPRLRSAIASGKFNGRLVAEVSEGVRLLLNLQEEGLPLSVQPMPSAADMSAALHAGRLQWSAVIGIFPSLPETLDNPAPATLTQNAAPLEWEHAFTLLALDPSQQAVLRKVQQSPLTVVEGASGSGKTYLISALIINALSNGKKCLVVSKNIQALRRAQKFLLDKGFGDVSFIIRDMAGDQTMLSDMLRNAADNKAKPLYEEDLYRTALNSAKRERNKLDEAWQSLHAPFFGKISFVDMVGQYLRSNRIENKDLLLTQLHPGDFTFDAIEYEDVTAAISSSEPLFLRFPTLRHPLGKLKDRLFLEYQGPQAKQATEKLVQSLLQQATALHHQYLSRTNDYNEALTEHYEDYYNQLADLSKRIRDGIEDGVFRFGSDFETASPTVDKMYGMFSDRYKQALAAKEKIVEYYKTLREAHYLRRYFEFDFPTGFDPLNMRKTGELIKDFDSALKMWRRRVPAVIRDDVKRLSVSTIREGVNFREPVQALERDLDGFLEQFNDASLYGKAVKHEMLTIPKRQEFLEEIIGRLEDTRFYLRDFDDFYTWQKHWLNLRPAAQKVVQALCKIKPKNWQAAFDSWYFYHLLQKQYNPAFQWSAPALQRYAEAIDQLNLHLPKQISAYWQQRKNKALRALRSTDPNAFKIWFSKDNRTLSATQRPEDVILKHTDALTETLPVLLVTPQVALDVVHASNQVFDLVLVDEAHNIAKQECYHLFRMANHLVVFGDAKQDMTPFAEDDFLEYCKSIEAETVTLEYQHQDTPEEWLAFNRVAFGTPFKRLPSGRAAKDVTLVANVEGRYDERAKINEAEARQIIDWLNLVEQTPAKTYPVVGIACATTQQRDLISSQLLQIRQRQLPGYEKIQQLHLNGLGVYQFAELQGQHVDILLLSLTHGLTDAQGTLTKDLQVWNTHLGLNQLHVALTRATQKIFIAHSLPSGLHAALSKDATHLGTSILSHLVTFGDHVQEGRTEEAAAQLVQMQGLLQHPAPVYPTSIFREEVEIALQPYFEPDQIRRNAAVEGVIAPILLDIAPNNRYVLLIDGVLSKSEHPSYEWEEKVRHYFNRRQVGYIPVLSGQWWKSPKQEARKIGTKVLL